MALSIYTSPLTPAQQGELRFYAETAYPCEACGFILNDGSLVKVPNISTTQDQFVIAAEDYATWNEDIYAIWHTHANYSGFSPADIQACKKLGKPFAVWNCGSSEAFWLDPSQDVGLLERPWNYGIWDCYAAVRDWFHQQWGVTIGDYDRLYEGEWSTQGFTHFEDNYKTEGFLAIGPNDPVERGDMILFRIRNKYTSNHTAVVEDPATNMLYQHLVGRVSGLSAYSTYFRENTHMILRRSN